MPKRETSIRQGLVLFAKNKKRVSIFYQQTLGLGIIEQQSSHDLLHGNGIEIVVHAIPKKIAAEIDMTEPPNIREDMPFKPTFVVADLEAVRASAEKTGGHLKPIEDAWHIQGAVVIDGWDPEGNVVQFKQYGR